jgi:hypothetical protein
MSLYTELNEIDGRRIGFVLRPIIELTELVFFFITDQ